MENKIAFKNIKGYMMFTLVYENEQTQEVSLEVGCAEDIEMQMEMFFEKNWKDLFSDWYDPFNFMYATFNGIQLSNKDTSHVSMQIYNNYRVGSASFDFDGLADKNADKLKRIREIAAE